MLSHRDLELYQILYSQPLVYADDLLYCSKWLRLQLTQAVFGHNWLEFEFDSVLWHLVSATFGIVNNIQLYPVLQNDAQKPIRIGNQPGGCKWHGACVVMCGAH